MATVRDLREWLAGMPDEYDNMKLNEARQEFEKKLIVKKLEETGYNITKTAQLLGVYPSNLHSKMKKYGIEMKK